MEVAVGICLAVGEDGRLVVDEPACFQRGLHPLEVVTGIWGRWGHDPRHS